MDIEKRLANFAELVIRRRLLVVTMVVATSLVLGVGMMNVMIDINPDQQLPQAHPHIQTLNRIHRLFGDKNLVIIGLSPTHGTPFEARFLETVRSLTQEIAQLPGTDPKSLKSLASRATSLVSRRAEELLIEPVLPDAITPDSVATVRARLTTHPIFNGLLVSYDASTVAVYCTIELSRDLPGYVHIHRAVRELLDQASDGTFSYRLSGPVVIASQLNTEANRIFKFFLGSIFIIALVHYQAFRSWQAVALPILTGLLAVVWAIGLMGHLRISLDPFNATTPILILAIGAGHAVQLLKRYYEELESGLSNHASIVRSLETTGMVMLASGSMTAFSFLSLVMLGTQSMRTFGILTAFGIASALLIELTLIPAIRSISAPHHSSHHSTTSQPLVVRALTRIINDRKALKIILATYVGLVVACAWYARKLEVDTSFKNNLSRADTVRIDDDYLNRQFAGTNDLLFLLETHDGKTLTSPEATSAIDRFQRRLESIPDVGKTISFVDTVRAMHSAIRDSDDTSALPSSEDLTAQYLFLYSLSADNDLSTMLSPDFRVGKVTILLRSDSTRYGEAVIAEARRIAEAELPAFVGLSIAGTLASNAALTEVMVRGKLLNILQVICVTALASTAIFRSALAGALVVVPVAASILLNFGLMGMLSVPMDVGSSVVSALSVGIGADYAVYFLARVQEELRRGASSHSAAVERAITTSGTAVVFVASAIAFGYLVLCASGFRLFVQLGAMVGIAMFTAAGSTIVILPSLLLIAAPVFRFTTRVSSPTSALSRVASGHSD